MKKYINLFLIMILIAVASGCKKSEEKAVLEFGIQFGEMVQNQDAKGIKSVYPDVDDYTSSHLKFYRDKIDIFPEEDGKYKVRYSEGAYIIVKTGLNGAMEVVSSQGIFDTTPKAEAEKPAPEIAASKEDKPARERVKPEPAPRRVSSVFNNGYNYLKGDFYYKGGTYGFSVSFNYNTATGRVSSAVYYADYNTSGARNPISSMTISADERSIRIKGPRLSISVSGSPGSYSGSMTRGDHSGRCSIWN